MVDQPQFEPLRRAHAIDRCAVTLTFEPAVPDKLFRFVLREYAESAQKSGLIPQSAVPSFEVDMDTRTVRPIADAMPNSFRTGDGGQISITPSTITVLTTRYVRWEHFRRSFVNFITPIGSSFLNAVSISRLKLEYWDRFNWTGTWKDFDPFQLIENRAFVVASAVGHVGWHTHSGWFESPEGDGQRLVNVNINAVSRTRTGDTEPRPSIQIHTLMEYRNLESREGNELEQVWNLAERGHVDLKAILGGIISREMQNRISLNAPPAVQ